MRCRTDTIPRSAYDRLAPPWAAEKTGARGPHAGSSGRKGSAIKQIVVIPIYWGPWWIPAAGNAYNWAEVNGLLQTVVGGRYMDYLNQYGVGRGNVSTTYVHPLDPPELGFSDCMRDHMFRLAINGGHVPAPSDYDLARQQPFYCLLVKPGIEHLRSPSLSPDVNTGAYHYPFQPAYWDGGRWSDGQVCWVKGDMTVGGTVRRLLHEMAQACSGAGQISDRTRTADPAVGDGVTVLQYWSVATDACQPVAAPAVSPPTRVPKVALCAQVLEVLFGILDDDGGLVHDCNAPVPDDAWGWLTNSQVDVAFARTELAVAGQFRHDPPSRRQATTFLRDLQRLVESDGDESERRGKGKGSR